MNRYKKLKGEMAGEEVDQKDLAAALKCSPTYVYTRFAGKYSWRVDDAYTILDYLHIPREQIFEYFPPNV